MRELSKISKTVFTLFGVVLLLSPGRAAADELVVVADDASSYVIAWVEDADELECEYVGGGLWQSVRAHA